MQRIQRMRICTGNQWNAILLRQLIKRLVMLNLRKILMMLDLKEATVLIPQDKLEKAFPIRFGGAWRHSAANTGRSNENMVRSGKRNSTDQKVRGRFQVYVQTEGGAVNNGINERDSK